MKRDTRQRRREETDAPLMTIRNFAIHEEEQ
jgi:hypothetical protein